MERASRAESISEVEMCGGGWFISSVEREETIWLRRGVAREDSVPM